MKNICFSFLLVFYLQNLVAQQINNFGIDKFIENREIFSKVNIGFSAFIEGKEVASVNSQKLFIPASTIKIFFTLAGIDKYGDDFKYKTKFFYTGNILADGTLDGDLLIYAGGDPTLGSKRFYENGIRTVFEIIERGLEKKGINCIDGDIILIQEFKSYPVNGTWSFEDIGNYYAGGYFPFNINENEYSLFFKTGKKQGDPTEITRIYPELYGLEVKNYVKTGKRDSGDNAYVFGIPFSDFREVKGTLPPGRSEFKIRASMPNPSETFMFLLSDYLEEKNIFYNNLRINNKMYDEKQFLFSIVSPSLLNISKECNDYSINLFSEAIAQLLCLKNIHPNDYLSNEEFHDFFSKYDFYQNGNQIVDGCGLSADNLISPKSMNSFINLMVKKIGWEKVKELFPHAGEDGNFKNMFDKNEGIWLKSGSISGVLNYTGIKKSESGDIVFTIMVNNIPHEIKKSIKRELVSIVKMLK